MIALVLALGCRPAPDTGPFPYQDPYYGVPEGPVRGFYWVQPDVLASMPKPYGAEIEAVADEGIDVLVTLTESPLDPSDVASAGMQSVHIPIPDFHAPTPEQAKSFTDIVATAVQDGERVGVHCLAGLGRSGTMSAIWLVHEGFEPEDAISHVRELRPGSIETDEQEQSIFDFAAGL